MKNEISKELGAWRRGRNSYLYNPVDKNLPVLDFMLGNTSKNEAN